MVTRVVEAEGPGSIDTVVTDYLEYNQSGDLLSAEDIAWVDSCLVKDPAVSEADWSSLKDALFQILTLHPESEQLSSAPVSDSLGRGGDTDMIPAGEVVALRLPGQMDDDDDDGSVPMSEETGRDDVDIMEKARPSSSHDFEPELSETSLRNAFLPSYNEDDVAVLVSADAELDMGIILYDVEPSTEDIFKVWDLNFPAEEGELVKQLNKAISESSVRSKPQKSNDLGSLEDLKDEPLDNLIASISNLALNCSSG